MANIFENASITAYGDRMQLFGLGSDYDTKSLLEAELNMLQLRQQPYTTKKSEYQGEKSTWTAFQTSLSNFNKIVADLKNLSTDSKDAALSEEGFLSVSANSNAADASYSVSVQQIATKHRVGSDKQTDGPLNIAETALLNGKELKITEEMTLKDISKAINEGDYGLSSVVLDNRLVFTSNVTGTENKISFDDSTVWETLGFTQDNVIKNELQEAKKAEFTINGIPLSSSTNSYKDVDGVSFNFTKETTSDIEVTISRSADQVVEKMTAVINAYNTVIGNINTLNGEGGDLQGESLPRTLKSSLNSLLQSVIDPKTNTMMFQLGISLDKVAKNGTVSFDEAKLREMYSNDAQAVQNVLIGNDSFSGKLYDLVEKYSKDTGLIQDTIDGLDSRIKRINETLEQYERDFERQKESLILKYATFETNMSALNSQNDYILAMLGNDKDD